MTDDPFRPRVLLLADDCNPQWPSLPVVGYKYARALAAVARVVLATHVRNRENIEAAADGLDVVYLDNEYVAAPMYRVAQWLRGGDQVAWSTSMVMAYLPYLAFEREAWKRFRPALRAGEFDIVHRITPMSPSLPSYMAGRTRQPFVLGPLNGNLDWPRPFAAEQRRERERLRAVRSLYRHLPYARRTQTQADCILAAFRHTRRDLRAADSARVLMMPEIGFDPEVFDAAETPPAGRRGTDGRMRFLFAGRLVPYKLPELAVRAVAGSELLRAQCLHIVGDGPERPRLEAIIRDEGLDDCVKLEGRTDQSGVADWMRRCDVFVFPSIRELGAGVVIEAMATGMHCIVTDYGAPGDLAAQGRGDSIPMAPFDDLVSAFRAKMEQAVIDPERSARVADAGRRYAFEKYTWTRKAERTAEVYRALIDNAPLPDLGYE